MKRLLLILSIFTLPFALHARGEDLPKRLDFTRYAAMLSHSPFAVATAPIQAPTAPNWSKDLYIANAARTSEADYITIVSGSDKNLHEYVSTAEPNPHGYSIANIQWSDQQGETKATISKDGQYATLGFNQALMSTSAPSAPQPQPSGVLPAGMNQPKPFPTPNVSVPVPTPHVRGMIEKNPRVQGQPGVAATPFVPPGGQ